MSRHKYESKILGAQLRAMRKAVGMLQREVAEKIHVSANTVTSWETGKSTPVLMDLDAYLKVVGGTMTFGKVA
jgi:transcriptional regulator with XRE-family HTH domain